LALKRIRFLLLSEDAGRVKKITIPRVLFVLSILLFLSSTAYFLFILGDYKSLRAQAPKLAQIQKEYEHQKEHFDHLSRKLEGMSLKMGELDEFDRRLKGLVELESTEERLAGGGDAIGSTSQDLIQWMNRSWEERNGASLADRPKLLEFQKFLQKERGLHASTPSLWPVRGWVTSPFGPRISPITGEREFHRGIDVAAKKHAPVLAPADGIVSAVALDPVFGQVLTLRHGYGMVTRYAHLNKFLVKEGQFVMRGEVIALVGETGRTLGPHLHYEVHLNGVAVNPLRIPWRGAGSFAPDARSLDPFVREPHKP
jgi:murein DD-endopeptidase MepM/ murein hydrolase activator NlpD